ncbi:hypothetical protein KUTeg_002239 [Tegillarca granosa]|uniref:Uncharacterized protein n=1 Tax=Tegillarca granosa TaxID=220873 RepID=A0ABQ9FXC3_TEGGR|nr:hypothetical protein KUTeg_002239 [Tegillarca granosa]
MAFSARDVRDVSQLVAKKLDTYLNKEKRENRFDPAGFYRTTYKMHKYDLVYKVLDRNTFDKKSPRYHKKKKKSNSDINTMEDDHHHRNNTGDGNKDDDSEHQTHPINVKVKRNTRRVALYREADRLAEYAGEILSQQPLENLQVIHRYRPSYTDKVPNSPDTGYVHNYTRHVGSILHTKSYIDYYLKEGLQTGKKEKSKRLQELKQKKYVGQDESCDGYCCCVIHFV